MELIDILQAMSQYNLIRLGKVTGDWHTLHCPFHKDGQERKPSCGVLLRDQYRAKQRWKAGTFHCFTCGTVKTFREGVKYILDMYCKEPNVRVEIENMLDVEEEGLFEALLPKDMVEALTDKYAIEHIQELTRKADRTYVSEEELAGYRFTCQYMYDRKLTDPVIEEYDVGVDMNWVPPGRKKAVPCITFPVRDLQGRTLFIYRRSIEGKLFNAPEGVEKPVYGLDRVPADCKSLILCESIINALTLRTYGYNAVALLGTGNSLQIQQLKETGIPEFIVCMDGDEAGRRATAKLKRQLSKNALIWTINMIDGQDVNSITREEFEKLYAERE